MNPFVASMDVYAHAKNSVHTSTHSWDNGFLSILQHDWLKSTLVITRTRTLSEMEFAMQS